MDQPVDATALANVEMLSSLPPDALAELARHARMRTYGAGETIFRRGDLGTSLHVVVSGAVDIIQPAAPDAPVAVMHPGEAFGELAVFDPQPRSASAVAATACQLLELDKRDLEIALEAHPRAALGMIGSIARSLTKAKEQVTIVNRFLDQRVRERTADVRETQLEVIRRLGRAAEFRDEDTGTHLYRMSNYAAMLALAAGFDEERAETLLHAAPMHDVGKIGVPDRILLKPAKLDADEWVMMKAHTTMGAAMLSGSSSNVIQLAQRIAQTHHERWDGGGYPDGIKGEEIPIEARICSIADVFDALTSARPYKQAWTTDDAFTEVTSLAGKAFDPELVELFTQRREQIEAIQARSLDPAVAEA